MTDYTIIKKKLDASDSGDLEERLGMAIFEAVNEYDNSYEDIGSSFVHYIGSCKSQKEFDAMSNMCIAITGYSVESILERV